MTDQTTLPTHEPDVTHPVEFDPDDTGTPSTLPRFVVYAPAETEWTSTKALEDARAEFDWHYSNEVECAAHDADGWPDDVDQLALYRLVPVVRLELRPGSGDAVEAVVVEFHDEIERLRKLVESARSQALDDVLAGRGEDAARVSAHLAQEQADAVREQVELLTAERDVLRSRLDSIRSAVEAP